MRLKPNNLPGGGRKHSKRLDMTNSTAVKKSREAEMPETENKLRLRVKRYLDKMIDEHGLIYRFDLAGLYTDHKQAQIMIKQLNGTFAGFPDLWICKPIGCYAGMFIELKRSGTTKRSLLQPTTDHGKQQLAMIRQLQKIGFAACFGIGFDDTKNKLIQYVHRKPIPII